MSDFTTSGLTPYNALPYEHVRMGQAEQFTALQQFMATMRRRRTIREYSSDPVPFELVAQAIRVASWAPSGAQRKVKHYYVQESVGIAVGMLLCALTCAGLATLTHTPSPMGFLGKVLQRPANEHAYVLIPVGYPAPAASVPAITKKPLEQVLVHFGTAE